MGLFSTAEILALQGGRRPPAPVNYKLPDKFPSFNKSKRVALDLESVDKSIAEDKGPGWRRGASIVGFSVALGDAKGNVEFSEYYPLRHKNAPNLPLSVLDWLGNEVAFYRGEIVGANLLYDMDGFSYESVTAPMAKFRDVQFAEALLDENAFNYRLERLAQKYCGHGKITDELEQLYGPGYKERFNEVHPGHARSYGLGDVDLPLRILAAQNKALRHDDQEELFDLECRLIPVLLYMRRLGQRVDLKAAEELRDKLFARREECLAEASKLVGTELTIENFGKTSLLTPIFERLGIPVPRTAPTKNAPDGNPSIKDKWLDNLDHPFGKKLSAANRYDKALETFVNGYVSDFEINGRIHCEFHPLRSVNAKGKSNGTVAGRFSAVHPNLQNIPVRDEEIGPLCRGMFVADEGMEMFSGDYSQIEYREIVHAATTRAEMPKEKAVKMWGKDGIELWEKLQTSFVTRDKYINDPTTDFHKFMATLTGLERKYAKCLDGDTLVSNAHGIFPIKQLVGETHEEQHGTITRTELANGQGNWTAATSGVVRRKVPCVFVVTRQAIVCCSKEHRWLTKNGLVRATDLAGEALPIARIPALRGCPKTMAVNLFDQSIGNGAATLLLDEKWAYLAGIFHGDGTANESSISITHGCGDDYVQWRHIIRQAARAVGIIPKTDKTLTATSLGSRVASRIFAQLGLIRNYGYHRKHLRVPQWVLAGGPKVALAYIAGLVDTDGTIGENTNLSITTHSADYAGQLAYLLRALGYQTFVGACWNKKYKRYYFRVCVAAADLRELASELPLRTEKGKKLIARSEKVIHARQIISDTVKHVLDAGLRDVYDFHVEATDHLYLQGGLIGHNSVNFAVAFVMGLQSFAEGLGWIENGKPNKKAIDTLNTYHTAVPFVKAVGTCMTHEADELGYTVSLLNRRAHYDLWEPKWRDGGERLPALPLEKAKAEYGDKIKRSMTHAALNRYTQMGGADMMKTTMVRVFESGLLDNPEELTITMTIHDELGGSKAPNARGDERMAELQNIMEHAVTLSVPTTTEFKKGHSWADTH